MVARVEFWFEFASTYSYLSTMRIDQAASDRGVVVDWQPFLLGPIFAEQGWTTSPFNLYPAKGTYMWRDMERLCSARGLPFQKPDPFPQNGLRAARLVLAIENPADKARFVCAVYNAEFGDGRDISNEATLLTCLDKSGLSPDLLHRTAEPDIKSALFQQTERAKEKGIFGAPSFCVSDELFWGDDRLDEALDYATQI